MMKRISLLLACCLLLVDVAFAKTQAIVTRDGRKIVGEVTEVEGGYKVQTSFGEVFVRKDDVVRIQEVTTPREEYLAKLAKIDINKAEEHYELGEWAFRQGLLTEAQSELRAVLKLEKNHEKARLLMRLVEAKIDRTKLPTPGTPGTGVRKFKIKNEYLVSREDIYRIRIEEWRRKNDVVRVRFRNDLIRRFIKMMQGRSEFASDNRFREKFLAWSPMEKLRYIMLNEGDNTSVKKDIHIESDPAFMKEFRLRIWPLLARGCADSACHGAPGGVGGLKLFNVPSYDERIPYTNFAILVGYTFEGGRRLIDRSTHKKSVLLQYGLPPKMAQRKHSKEIPPLFVNNKNVNYKRVLQWIEGLSKPNYPDYRLRYRPPFGMKLNLSGGSSLPPVPEPRDESEKEKSPTSE
ncbi:MAG: hypothetical protein QF577_00625 [Phycisphaerae bacterium]|nr:hypothetical protein [Phycisphaerae bacterium]